MDEVEPGFRGLRVAGSGISAFSGLGVELAKLRVAVGHSYHDGP